MGPLAGLRIVEMDALGPVPLAAMILADMGADIIRVIRPGGQTAYEDVGGAILHRSRPFVEIDLKSENGREALLNLLGSADALIEGFRPGVMERLGLGPAECLARNPSLVYGRMTGWGQTGPLSQRAGHDINYIAIAGALGMMGPVDRPPAPPLNLVGDYGGGAMFLALGVLAAVISARGTGKGQFVDAAMTDGTAVLLSLFLALRQSGHWSDARNANLLDGGAPFYRCYACADGRHVAVGALEPQFFAALLDGLGLPADAFDQNDRSGWPAMQARFTTLFASRTRDEWTTVFADKDACVSPVLMIEEAVYAKHNAARSTFIEVAGTIQPAPAPRFSETKSTIQGAGKIDVGSAHERWKER